MGNRLEIFARDIIQEMPDIRTALRRALGERNPEEAKLRARVMLAWADGRTMQQLAKDLLIGVHRVHRIVNFGVRYLNAHAAEATDARQLIADFLAEPMSARRTGRPTLPPEIRGEILRLRKERWSYRRLAGAVGCSLGTVASTCKLSRR